MIALSPWEVHIWQVRVWEVPQDCLERYPALLTEAERARWQRFVFTKDRHHYLVARALVRCVLSRYGPIAPQDWRFSENPYGKPEIVPVPGLAPLRFNLSHTEGLAACAVTLEHAIGVDVENWGRSQLTLEIAQSFFAQAEVDYLKTLPPEDLQEALFAFWTLKEAYIKAKGIGLSLSLKSFAFTLEPLGIRFSQPADDDPTLWQFARVYPTHQHRLALAVCRPAGMELRVIYRETVPLAEEDQSDEPGSDSDQPETGIR